MYKKENGLLLPDKIYRLDSGSPLSSFTAFNGTTKDPNYETTPEVSYDRYDSKGNPLTISGRDGIRTSYYWGYNDQYPVAKIDNMDYSQVLDHEGNLVKDFSYKYKQENQTAPLPPLSVSVSGDSEIDLGEMIEFSSVVSGGSNNYSYRWELKKGSTVVTSSVSPGFSYLPTTSGTHTLHLSVTDSATGEEKSQDVTVTIRQVNCQFVDINPPNGYSTYVRTGRIYTPLADVVHISYKTTGRSSEYVQLDIGARHFANLQVGTTYTLSVQSTRQGYIDCKVQLPDGGTNYVEIVITGLQNNTTTIGYPSKISIPDDL